MSTDEPTQEQVDTYRRDGFLVVEGFVAEDQIERVREHFGRAFAHDWETGLAPDEVNYEPGRTAPDLTRQLCNVWKADRVLAATTLARRNAAFAARLAGVSGLRLAHDNAIWKPPSGRALLCHQDAAYCEWLDPPNMTTCWMALDDTAADTGTIFYVRGSNHWPRSPVGGTFHAPDDWLGYVRRVMPAGAELELVPIAVAPSPRCTPPRGRLPQRVDVPRQPAERARGRRATRAHQPHDHDRHPLESGPAASCLLTLPAPGRDGDRRGVLSRHVAGGRLPLAVDRRLVRRRLISPETETAWSAGGGCGRCRTRPGEAPRSRP
jgi:Phytanoyl-CoA dioxygenase (PhyH)